RRQQTRSTRRRRVPARARWIAAPVAACAFAATAQPSAPAGAASAAPAAAASAPAGAASTPPVSLRMSETLQAPPRGDPARQLPIILRAREVRGRPDVDASAEGDV